MFSGIFIQCDGCIGSKWYERKYLVIDNSPIYTPDKVSDLVESTGYECLYLPPYTPFLNPIEQFWSQIKAGIRTKVVTAHDRLSDRICESVQQWPELTAKRLFDIRYLFSCGAILRREICKARDGPYSTILSLLCSRTFHPITVRYSVVRPLFELFKQRNY